MAAPAPVIAREESVPEFTLRAAAAGVALRRRVRRRQRLPRPARRPHRLDLDPDRRPDRRALPRPAAPRGPVILEANLSQTIGSASSSLASGTIFTIPALFLWGFAPPLWQVAMLAFLGGVLGISAMMPLRRLLIVRSADELPYPEGTACAAGAARDRGRRRRRASWIFLGLAVGAAVKLALGGGVLMPSELSVHVPVLPKAELALEIAPALLAVGYILGYRQSAIMVSGSLISALVLIPLIALVGRRSARAAVPRDDADHPRPERGPDLVALRPLHRRGRGGGGRHRHRVRTLPTMYALPARRCWRGLRGARRAPRATVAERTDRDLPGWVVLAGAGAWS